jgi:hypothetical protein
MAVTRHGEEGDEVLAQQNDLIRVQVIADRLRSPAMDVRRVAERRVGAETDICEIERIPCREAGDLAGEA